MSWDKGNSGMGSSPGRPSQSQFLPWAAGEMARCPWALTRAALPPFHIRASLAQGCSSYRDSAGECNNRSSCSLSRACSHVHKNDRARSVLVAGESPCGQLPEVLCRWALEFFGFSVLEGLMAPNSRIVSSFCLWLSQNFDGR